MTKLLGSIAFRSSLFHTAYLTNSDIGLDGGNLPSDVFGRDNVVAVLRSLVVGNNQSQARGQYLFVRLSGIFINSRRDSSTVTCFGNGAATICDITNGPTMRLGLVKSADDVTYQSHMIQGPIELGVFDFTGNTGDATMQVSLVDIGGATLKLYNANFVLEFYEGVRTVH